MAMSHKIPRRSCSPSGRRMRFAAAPVTAALALAGVALLPAGVSAAGGAGVEHVSTTGTDSGNCISSPCATVNYAISVAPSGETIKVAAGTYNQTVDIDKPIDLVGAGAQSTVLNGAGLDPSNNGYFGVVYIGDTGGAVTVTGFTITNPEPYTYTGGEPMAVVLYNDPNSGDSVNITSDDITEGTADSSASQDFPIGIDTLLEAGTVTVSGDTVSGFFQGALFEDNGPAKVNSNQIEDLITGTDTSTSPPTVYQPEGIFFLADEGGTYTGQDAAKNTFSGYSGDGIDEAAGYQGGYVTPGCIANGSITTALKKNVFALTAGQPGTAIFLQATGGGNSLTGTLKANTGYVTKPSNGIEVQSVAATTVSPPPNCSPYAQASPGAGTIDVVQNKDDITVKKASAGPESARAGAAGGHLLHVPHLRGRRSA